MLLVFAIALAGLFVWSLKHMTNTYALTPGLAQPVGPLITISDQPHGVPRRSILLTDVYLTQLTSWQWLIDQIDPPAHEQLISGDQLTGPSVPTSELYDQGFLEMYDSQSDAKVAALRALSIGVFGDNVGATVTAIATDAPIANVVSVADRIVWARGHAVTNDCGLISALAGAPTGQRIALKVERAHINGVGTITGYSRPKLVEVPTSPVTPGAGSDHCQVAQQLEIGIENAVQWHLPFGVTIDTANIGGPSAGLAMTLGIIDALSRVSITGHLKIAATGQIYPNGDVGDVGGVAEKTIAVENAGATVFLVPPPELGVAKRAASPGLTVIAVSTLEQALAAIKRLSGVTPVPIAAPTSSGSARA